MMVRLPDYRCPYNACDGSGWTVDETTRTASRCQCMGERIELRDRHAAERHALTGGIPATPQEPW